MLNCKGHNGQGCDVCNALSSQVAAEGSLVQCAVMSQALAMQSTRAMAVMSEGMAMQCSATGIYCY